MQELGKFDFKINGIPHGLEIYMRFNNSNNKCSCCGHLTFKSQRVGYQPNQNLLHHYQHSKNQLNSPIFGAKKVFPKYLPLSCTTS